MPTTNPGIGDPFLELLRDAEAASPEPEPMEPAEPTPGDDNGPQENRPGLDRQQQPPSTPTSFIIDFPTLQAYGRQLKTKRTLSTEAQAELDVFVKTTAGAPAPQLILIFWMLLLIWDLLRKLVKSEAWQIPNDLRDNVQVYTQAFIMSPTVNSYRGRAAEVVLGIMRDLNVRNIPPETEPAQLSQVLTLISDYLTRQRNLLKSKIKESLSQECEFRNVADLAATIIGSHRQEASLELYMRLAFLRYHMVKYPNLEEGFWPHIDQALETAARYDPSTAFRALKTIYQADIEKYGNPETSEFRATAMADIDGMQKAVDSQASTVKPGKKRAVKRRRVMVTEAVPT